MRSDYCWQDRKPPTDREIDVMVARWFGVTIPVLARKYDVSEARIKQIFDKGMRRLHVQVRKIGIHRSGTAVAKAYDTISKD